VARRENRRRALPPTPFEQIAERARRAGLDPRGLPRRWEKVGDVLVLRFPPGLDVPREAIAPVYAGVLGAKTVVEKMGGVQGPWRLPQVRWVWGDGTETVHLEDGVRFKLDVAKVMFSSGNLDERGRMARAPAAGETVVDQFLIQNIHSQLPAAIRGRVKVEDLEAVGIIETKEVASAIYAADAAVKAAEVTLVEARNQPGAKGLVVLTGQLSAVRAAVAAGVATIKQGMLVAQVVIPFAHKALVKSLTSGS